MRQSRDVNSQSWDPRALAFQATTCPRRRGRRFSGKAHRSMELPLGLMTRAGRRSGSVPSAPLEVALFADGLTHGLPGGRSFHSQSPFSGKGVKGCRNQALLSVKRNRANLVSSCLERPGRASERPDPNDPAEGGRVVGKSRHGRAGIGPGITRSGPASRARARACPPP